MGAGIIAIIETFHPPLVEGLPERNEGLVAPVQAMQAHSAQKRSEIVIEALCAGLIVCGVATRWALARKETRESAREHTESDKRKSTHA